MPVLVVILTLAAAAAGGVLLVPAVLRLAQRRGGVPASSSQAILRGGLIIGILERVATAGSVVLGQPEGIAVVIAVKGLGRYPELRDSATTAGAASAGTQPAPSSPAGADPSDPGRSTTVGAAAAGRDPAAAALGAAVSERFIIGTLTSLIWAVAAGALGRWVLLTL